MLDRTDYALLRLLRLSVGIEVVEDLWDDLAQALAVASASVE